MNGLGTTAGAGEQLGSRACRNACYKLLLQQANVTIKTISCLLALPLLLSMVTTELGSTVYSQMLCLAYGSTESTAIMPCACLLSPRCCGCCC
jgi:hypothetical protein